MWVCKAVVSSDDAVFLQGFSNRAQKIGSDLSCVSSGAGFWKQCEHHESIHVGCYGAQHEKPRS